MTTREELNQQLDRLGETALKVKHDRDALLSAAKAIFAEIEAGNLVRDVSRDFEPGWQMHFVPMVKALAQLKQAIEQAEAEQPSAASEQAERDLEDRAQGGW
jgi:hypothetical protein